ncbi:MAG: MlaE family lipid ABC transporter permease subunit [Gammaproteobacteria bacterium]|nr:MlaE family lipid ABC transporter permease subunit [Gammaproteobacteria bacterium]
MPYTAEIHQDGSWEIRLAGDWTTQTALQTLNEPDATASVVRVVRFDAQALQDWDSALVVFVLSVERWARQRQVACELDGLPPRLKALVTLALSIPQRQDMAKPIRHHSLPVRIGQQVSHAWQSTLHAIDFIGELFMAGVDMLRLRFRFRQADFIQFLEDCGPRSLAITGLISFLIGMILAFVGAMQLEKFGAGIYVASLVGVSLSREMAPIMTGILMAGRTGAAYAAQLGSMQVNEEIDALRTLGVNPFHYLVMPRLLALVIMMPLLTLYANTVGILGGALVSVTLLDLSFQLFLEQLIATVPVYYFGLGRFKSVLFGLLIALAGCYMGLHCGRSATAVGQATTSAVVVAIVLIVVADSVVTVVTTLTGV